MRLASHWSGSLIAAFSAVKWSHKDCTLGSGHQSYMFSAVIIMEARSLSKRSASSVGRLLRHSAMVGIQELHPGPSTAFAGLP